MSDQIELRFCTIISNDGITIFHRSFIEDELDEYLFSGFSSAMIAFSKELGDELSLIKMEKQTIFYHEASEDGFLIMSISEGYDIDNVKDKISVLNERDSLNLLLAGSRLGIIQNENEKFERDLFEIFEVDETKKVIDEEPDEIEEIVAEHKILEMDVPQTKSRKSLAEQLEEIEREELEQLERQRKEEEEKTQAELSSVLDALEDWD